MSYTTLTNCIHYASRQHHSKTTASKYFEAVEEYWDENWMELTVSSVQ
jgi:hypothetical protein